MKTIVIAQRPILETERISSSRGSPEIPHSSGRVTSFSTSRWRHPAGRREHLHLHVGHIGKGVDRNLPEREDAEAGDDDRAENDQHALADGEFENRIDHRYSSPARPLSISDLRMKLPSVTTFSPSFTPSSTCTRPCCSMPVLTGRFRTSCCRGRRRPSSLPRRFAAPYRE